MFLGFILGLFAGMLLMFWIGLKLSGKEIVVEFTPKDESNEDSKLDEKLSEEEIDRHIPNLY